MAENELNMSELLRSAQVNVDIFDEDEDLDFPIGFVIHSADEIGGLVSIEFLGSIFGNQVSLVSPEGCLQLELVPEIDGFVSMTGGYAGSGGVRRRQVRHPEGKILFENVVVSQGDNVTCESVEVSLDLTVRSPTELESDHDPSDTPFDSDHWYPVKLKGSFGIGFGAFKIGNQNKNATLRFVRSIDAAPLSQGSIIELFILGKRVGFAKAS